MFVLATLLGVPAMIILIAAGLLHLYWAMGGTIGKRAAIPEVSGTPVLRPTAGKTGWIGINLLIAAAIVAIRLHFLTAPIPPQTIGILCWVLAAVSAARALGDFRLVGFFKKVKDSEFARLDTKIYSPACLFVSLAFIAAAAAR